MKACAYIRCSTTDQADHGVSLDAQREKVAAYALLKDMDLIEIIEDAGLSAKNLDRPGVQRVLEMVRNHEVQNVIVYKLDRLVRSTMDALDTAKLMDKHNVALHSITESLDTSSALGRFFFTITSALAELERNLISERTKTALQHKKANGKCVGQVPYGFRRDGDDLVPDAAEQDLLSTIANLDASSWNYSAIARHLNAHGYKTKSGKQFHAQTVKNILMQQEKGVGCV